MNTTTIMVGDQQVTVDQASASHILRTLAGLTTELANVRKQSEEDGKKSKADLEEEKKKGKDALDALTAKHTGEVTTLKDQLEKVKLTPQAIDALVVERHNVVSAAMGITGKDSAAFSGKSPQDIRRIAVDHVLKDKAKDWKDEAIQGAFDAMVVNGDGGPRQNAGDTDPIRTTFSNRRPANDVDDAYAGYVKDLQEGWKQPAAK